MAAHMALKRDFYEPFEGLSPGMLGLEDSERLLPHLGTKKGDNGEMFGPAIFGHLTIIGTGGVD